MYMDMNEVEERNRLHTQGEIYIQWLYYAWNHRGQEFVVRRKETENMAASKTVSKMKTVICLSYNRLEIRKYPIWKQTKKSYGQINPLTSSE